MVIIILSSYRSKYKGIMIRLTEEKGKNVGIFGLARTGIATYESLHGIAKLFCWDDKEQNRKNFAAVYGFDDLHNINSEAWKSLDYIVLSPGVPLYFPKPHPVVQMANLHKIPIVSDIELLYRVKKDVKYVGVTGTNGKSTTTSLIAHIMGNGFAACGNIGISPLGIAAKNGYALELSSYQLDLLSSLKLNVAVLLNITPDHLDRHNTMESYIEAKKRIWRNMAEGDVLVIGVDNDITARIYEEIKGRVPFEIMPISIRDKIDGLPHNQSLLGRHNLENVVASYSAAKALGKSHEEIMKRMATFVGLPHRMQFICSKGNVSFYNDSKATNAEAASKSLEALENIYWLAGGQSKEGGISSLTPLFGRVKKAYLFGQAREEFARTLDGKVENVLRGTMAECFALALDDAVSSGVEANILLAPACASFDQFQSFEHRGDEFIRMCMEAKTDF